MHCQKRLYAKLPDLGISLSLAAAFSSVALQVIVGLSWHPTYQHERI